MSDPGGPGSRDNPLVVLAQAGNGGSGSGRPARTSKAAASTPAPRQQQPRPQPPPDDAGPPTEPVAAPPRTARNLTRPRRTPKPTPDAAKGAGATLTGFLLVLLAVVIGIILLTKGYDRESGLISAPATTPTQSTSTLVPNSPVGNVPGVPQGSSSSLKPPSAVVVRVGKAGAQEGVASADAQKLKSAGYGQATAYDSNVTVPASIVYYQPGFQGEAIEVAKVFKIPESAVQAMPTPPPDPLGSPPASILVLLGPEARTESA